MQYHDLAEKADFIGMVAMEAVDESDAIERHPEIVDVLQELSGEAGLNDLFGSNGHDPAAFVSALAQGLAPYRQADLVEAPELVSGLAFVAKTLREGAQNGNGASPA